MKKIKQTKWVEVYAYSKEDAIDIISKNNNKFNGIRNPTGKVHQLRKPFKIGLESFYGLYEVEVEIQENRK